MQSPLIILNWLENVVRLVWLYQLVHKVCLGDASFMRDKCIDRHVLCFDMNSFESSFITSSKEFHK